jgi:hypothetical protein
MVVAARPWISFGFRGNVSVGMPSVGGSPAVSEPGTVVSPSSPTPAPDTPPGSGEGRLETKDVVDTTLPNESTTLNYTNFHSFDLKSDPSVPTYIASGRVGGSVNNQFGIDEKGGLLRVATTSQLTPSKAHPSGSTVNNLFILEPIAGSLEVKGSVVDLAPGERIFSTRFVGNRGYVVTFRQVDPLFVFDLSTPSSPKKLAELKIPGFSEYMHPLGDTHLLTIGRDGDADGRINGLALQIFDVTDGANPRPAFKFVYSKQGSSEASYEHRAFTFFAEKGLLAFPFVGYDNGVSSTLEVFHVDTATGFEKLGSIDHTALLASQSQAAGGCYSSYGPEVRRGLFLENVAYAVSAGGIIAADIHSLATPIATLPLEAAKFDSVFDGSGRDSVGGPIAAGGCSPTFPGNPVEPNVDGGTPRDGGVDVDGPVLIDGGSADGGAGDAAPKGDAG